MVLAVSGTAFAAEGGPPVLGTAVPGRGGAVFTVPPQSRTVWADVEWVAGGETNTVWRHLHLYGDGKERRYFFDGAAPVRWGANYPDGNLAEAWDGDIVSFRVFNNKTKEEVPVRDLRIVPGDPGLPPELILSHAKAPMELDRAGRPVDVEVGVFNAGTVAATGVTVRVEGLPDGVRLADADAAGRLRDLGGGDSVLHRVTVVADAPCAFTARLVFSGGNAPEAVAEVPVRIGPSLGLPQDLAYLPEPTPIATAPCEVGAFYFPDWARAHHWLKVWRFAPERRPALGWYSNDDPEVLDWRLPRAAQRVGRRLLRRAERRVRLRDVRGRARRLRREAQGRLADQLRPRRHRPRPVSRRGRGRRPGPSLQRPPLEVGALAPVPRRREDGNARHHGSSDRSKRKLRNSRPLCSVGICWNCSAIETIRLQSPPASSGTERYTVCQVSGSLSVR